MNQMRCISFAGPGLLEKRRYCRDTTCMESDLVQEAIFHLYHPNEIILCLSEPAAAHIASSLESRNIPVNKVWIPCGTDEDQLWEIFSILCTLPLDHEEILFDITAGCHSLPFMTFLAASYLHSVRHVTIRGVIYAPAIGDDGFCRFVDLKPLMDILDWIAGVRSVTHYVDAEPIYNLLNHLQGNIHRSGEEQNPPVRLTGWASLLWQFSDAVRLARPVDAMYAASGIVRDMDEVNEELVRYAPSLVPVLGATRELADLAAEPEPDHCSEEYIQKQIRVISFQLDKGLYLQAVTLAREVLITLLMIRMNVNANWLDADIRHQVSRTLTGGALDLQQKSYDKTQYSNDLILYPDWKELVRIWIRVSDLRNNLAHCGMNQRDDSIRSIRKRSSDILPDIERFMVLCLSGKNNIENI
ncbi:CRISPR-associated (Cas) DxTHG family protein [anaerobic digester metagenome]